VALIATRGDSEPTAGAETTNNQPASTPSTDTEPDDTPTDTEGPTPETSTPADANHVAHALNQLLRQEAQRHAQDNVAVGFVTDCTASPHDVQEIADFRDLRAQLLAEVQALPSTDDAALDSLRAQLVVIWDELVRKDEEYVAWAGDSPSTCPRTDKPTTSQRSKARRQAWRDSWLQLVADHPEWGVLPPGLLVEGGAGGQGTYLLL
jgi:hypothetical protein